MKMTHRGDHESTERAAHYRVLIDNCKTRIALKLDDLNERN